MILQVSWCSSLLLLPLVTHQLSFLDEFTTWQTQIASANIRIHCVYLYPFWVFTLAAHGQGYRKRLGNPMTLSICSWVPIKADVDVLPFKLLGSLGSFGLWFSVWSHHGRFQNSWAKASNSSPALFLGSRKKFRGAFFVCICWRNPSFILLARKRIVCIHVYNICYIIV